MERIESAFNRKALHCRSAWALPECKAIRELVHAWKEIWGWPVTRITTAAADEFKKQRRAAGAGPAMINRSLPCLRPMLRIAHEDETINRVPKIRFITEPPARKGFLPLEQFNELLELLPTHLRPLILFLYWCGVRKGEALQIQWKQVDLNARLIWLEPEQTKSNDGRVVPLPVVLVADLQEINPKVGPVFSDTNLRTEWEKAYRLRAWCAGKS